LPEPTLHIRSGYLLTKRYGLRNSTSIFYRTMPDRRVIRKQRPELAVIRSKIEQAVAGESAARSACFLKSMLSSKWQASDGLYIEPDKAWMGGVLLSWQYLGLGQHLLWPRRRPGPRASGEIGSDKGERRHAP